MLVSLAWPEARSEPATPGDPPDAVKQAIAKAAKDKITDEPAKVVVGAYINDIQQLDFKSNNYAVDFYVWFRWKGAISIPPRPWSS